jgi:hypothetical protein
VKATIGFTFTKAHCGHCNQRTHAGRWDQGNTSRCQRFFTKVRRAYLTATETAWQRCQPCINEYGPHTDGQ